MKMESKKDSLMIQMINAVRREIYPYIVFIIGLMVASCLMSFAAVLLLILSHMDKKKL